MKNAFVLILAIFLLLKTNIGFAYEREIILGEEYQVKTDKERIEEKKFGLDLGIGYGYSYIQFLTGLYGLDSKFETYLDKLDVKYSESYAVFRATAIYLISPKLGIYVGTPFGLVHTKRMLGTTFTSISNAFGVGDVYAGVYYHLLSETKNTPNVVVNFDANSNTTKYYSLGDGVWDFTPAIQARKMISNSFYVFGLVDYTYRKKESGVEPGGIIDYGGGIGTFLGEKAIEIGLKAATIGKTKLDGATWFDRDEDLAFNLGVKSSGGSFYLTIGNLDEGFDIRTNNFGIEISMPLF